MSDLEIEAVHNRTVRVKEIYLEGEPPLLDKQGEVVSRIPSVILGPNDELLKVTPFAREYFVDEDEE